MTQQHILNSIEEASKGIGKTWPLYGFVTSNPLSGYENQPFEEAVGQVRHLFKAKVYPEASVYRQGWKQGYINDEVLQNILKANGHHHSPEYYLQQLESQKSKEIKSKKDALDRIMVKWLSAFMDEGLAEWSMPYKEKGFYQAWRILAQHDAELGKMKTQDIPKAPQEALEATLKGYPKEDFIKIFSCHLAALPGWMGYIKYRIESNSIWHQAYPISLQDYLAVRFIVAKQLKLQILPLPVKNEKEKSFEQLKYLWLKAWEKSWQNQLVHDLNKELKPTKSTQDKEDVPKAQLVFCIDTRSELIRRHIETKGTYETFGYAGFFGIAMDYSNMNDGLSRKSCPPIVPSAYIVSEISQEKKNKKLTQYKRQNERFKFGEYFLKRMKNMLPSAFGFVEGSGFLYGLALMVRSLFPGNLYSLKTKISPSYEHLCQPTINGVSTEESKDLGIPIAEKVAIVKSAFDLTGWNRFAPLVFFVGHGSHSANNPFGSSLDCGACAASPGRHNARMLAKLANLSEVRKNLAVEHGIIIPDHTVFIGAEHNTTTDEILIFDAGVPDSHHKLLLQIKSDLSQAQQTATQERLGLGKNSVSVARQKANNWGETRPEWGLAKNAGFIIAPRELTKDRNLDGRCFLHSYNWERDTEGKALESILQGPMVVTQWINNHYYFSTVDNDAFGGGSKITHNITGKFGVVQGNGGDLKMGLPLQSVNQSDHEMYHQPLRLSVLIKAPLDWVNAILLRNENLRSLLDNEWIYVLVMDPMKENKIKQYHRTMKWRPTGDNLDVNHEPVNADNSILNEILS